MGMFLRTHLFQPLLFIVKESEAFLRIKGTCPVSHRYVEAELELEICSPESSLVSVLVTL